MEIKEPIIKLLILLSVSDHELHDKEREYISKIIEDLKNCYIIEVCIRRQETEDALKELNKLGIKELVRTGTVAISK